jgi:hypothetical protein
LILLQIFLMLFDLSIVLNRLLELLGRVITKGFFLNLSL